MYSGALAHLHCPCEPPAGVRVEKERSHLPTCRAADFRTTSRPPAPSPGKERQTHRTGGAARIVDRCARLAPLDLSVFDQDPLSGARRMRTQIPKFQFPRNRHR
jgi:hypothetical protein